MKFTIVILISILFAVSFEAQTETWWRVDDYGLDYKLPHSWRSDPFSTSSVCDCGGTINDNGGWSAPEYLGMVIYTTTNEVEQTDEDRRQVWSNEFEGATVPDTVEYAGIPYRSTYGTFVDLHLGEKAWQLVSLDKPGKGKKYLTVYFFGEPSLFDDNYKVFEQILETFERTKVKW